MFTLSDQIFNEHVIFNVFIHTSSIHIIIVIIVAIIVVVIIIVIVIIIQIVVDSNCYHENHKWSQKGQQTENEILKINSLISDILERGRGRKTIQLTHPNSDK